MEIWFGFVFVLDHGSEGSYSMYWLLSAAFCSAAREWETSKGNSEMFTQLPFLFLTRLNREKLFTCCRGCFTTVTSYRNGLKLQVLAETNCSFCLCLVSPRREDRYCLLCGTINPVISSARSKQITVASGHLHLIMPDDIILAGVHSLAQPQELSDPQASGSGTSVAPSCLHPTPAPAVGSWWEPWNRSTRLAFWVSTPNVFRGKSFVWLRPLRRTGLAWSGDGDSTEKCRCSGKWILRHRLFWGLAQRIRLFFPCVQTIPQLLSPSQCLTQHW